MNQAIKKAFISGSVDECGCGGGSRSGRGEQCAVASRSLRRHDDAAFLRHSQTWDSDTGELHQVSFVFGQNSMVGSVYISLQVISLHSRKRWAEHSPNADTHTRIHTGTTWTHAHEGEGAVAPAGRAGGAATASPQHCAHSLTHPLTHPPAHQPQKPAASSHCGGTNYHLVMECYEFIPNLGSQAIRPNVHTWPLRSHLLQAPPTSRVNLWKSSLASEVYISWLHE